MGDGFVDLLFCDVYVLQLEHNWSNPPGLWILFILQAKQFQQSHNDAHYASASFHYQKKFAVKFWQFVSYTFMDDKHCSKLGEPSYPVAAFDCGR